MTRHSLIAASIAALFSAACGTQTVDEEAVAAQGAQAQPAPKPATVAPLGPVGFTSAVTGSSATAVTWSVVEGSGCGFISAGGFFTASASPGTCTIIVRSVADTSKFDDAVVTITTSPPPPTVVVQVVPAAVEVQAGGSTTLSATVTGTSNTAVSWSVVEGASCGFVSATGVYTAPSSPSVCHVSAQSAADTSKSSTSTVTVSAPPTSSARYVGANIGWVSDWAPDNMWADILRQGRAWGGAVTRDTPIAVDAAGWPTLDTTIGFSVGAYGTYGIAGAGYKLSFTGQAAGISGPNLTVTNVAYNAASNTTTADVQVKANSSTWITFTGTKRNPSDAAGNGITNVHLMRPGHSRTADVFNKQWVATVRAAPFSLLRLVNPLGTDGVMSNKDSTWATRKAKPGAAAQSPTGISWEDAVLLANQVGVDVWINIPYHVDNDYITKVAQVFKYGSDGVTFLPFTGPVGSTPDPVSNPRPATHDPTSWTPGTSSWYPPLAAGRKVYVEFVNELWNTAGAYPNTIENQNDAKTEVNTLGDPKHLRYDNRADYWDVRRTAWNVARISVLFRQVFGDADMMTRVRPVLAGQAVNSLVVSLGMDYLNAVFGPSSAYDTVDGIPNPRKVPSYYVYAIATAPYIRWSSPATVDAAFTQLTSSVASAKSTMNTHDTLAARWGVKFAAYEGSTEIYQNDAFVKSVWADPRMTTLLSDYLHHFYSLPTADVFNHYTMISSGTDVNGSFGLSYDILTTNTPRWQAFKDVAQGR